MKYQGCRVQGEEPETERPVGRERSGRAKRAILIAAVIVAVALVAAVIAYFSWNQDEPAEQAAEQPAVSTGLVGTWRYEDVDYTFDEAGNGSMDLEKTGFAYTYRTEGEHLYIDFEDEIVSDAEYTYSVSGDSMTLVGGEGTDGGTYQLTRVQ